MRRFAALAALIVLTTVALSVAQSGVGGGGQSNVSGGGTGSGGVGAGAAPIMAVYLSPQCPAANTSQCFNTPADTQQSQACSWTAATPATVTCGSQLILASAAVASNVATYTFNNTAIIAIVPATWVNGNSITITGFTGGDAFFNQTCAITATTTNSVSCALTHANASSSTSGVVTNTSIGPFVSADVGKQVMGWQNCEAFATSAVMGTNAITTSGAPLITSFVSATQVQITTAANAQVGQTGCFIWGHPDDTAVATAEAAWVNYPFCPRVELAASNYMFTQPHFYNQPVYCAAEGTAYPNGAGNVFYSAGFEVEGRGTGNTVIYLMPNFPNGDAGTRGIDSQSYFYIPLMGKWKDFQITGGSQANSSISGTHSLISGQVITLENITLTNMGAFANGGPVIFGITLGWQSQLFQVQNSGWGNAATQILANEGYVTAMKSSFENSLFSGVQVNGPPGVATNGYSFTCYDCRFFNSQNSSIGNGNNGNVINNKGGSIALYNTLVKDGGQTFLAGQIGYLCQTAGCTLRAINTDFKFNDATSYTSIKCTAACTNYIENSSLTSGATGNSYVDAAGSKLFDLGGNSFGTTTLISGSVFGDASITGTALAASNLTPTSGFGTGCSTAGQCMSAVTGTTRKGQFTVTYGTGPSSPQVLTIVFPVPFIVTPICSLTDVGGTNAFPTSIVTTTCTATGASFTITNTPIGGNTDILQLSASTP